MTDFSRKWEDGYNEDSVFDGVSTDAGVEGTAQDSDPIVIGEYEGVHVSIEDADSGTSSTDELTVDVYGSMDELTDDEFSTSPIDSFTLDGFDSLQTQQIHKIYQGWLYAAVANSDGSLAGLFVTKDFGQTWTLIQLPTVTLNPDFQNSFATINPVLSALPSNDPSLTDYDPISSQAQSQGNYNISLAVDPKDPSVVYLGGTSNGQSSGLIRVDITGLYDSHAFVGFDGSNKDGGQLQINTTGRLVSDFRIKTVQNCF